MRKFELILIGTVVTCALIWGAINFHVFRTARGVVVSVKRSPTLADIYVDVRDWGIVQWSEFPDLAWSLARSSHADVVNSQPTYEISQKIEVEVHR